MALLNGSPEMAWKTCQAKLESFFVLSSGQPFVPVSIPVAGSFGTAKRARPYILQS